MSDSPGAPVQVLMPAGLLPRLAAPLAVIGMRVYRLPMRDGVTLMVGADLSELRDDTPFTTQDVLDAWSLAAEQLAESAQETKRPKTRKRKAARDAA